MDMDDTSSADAIAVRRGQRKKKKSTASSALERIRRERETGVREESELAGPDKLFDYVTEDEYSRLVQERQTDKFILDDDGSYSEHGREIFDEEVDPQSGEQGSRGAKKPPGKGPVKRKVAKPGGIKAMVMGMGGGAKKRKTESSASIADDELLADMLQQMESRPLSTAGPRPHSNTPQRKPSKFTPRLSSTPSTSQSHNIHPSPGHTVTKKVRAIKKEERQPSPPPSPPPPSPPPSPPSSPPPPLGNEDNEIEDGVTANQDSELVEEERPNVGPLSSPEAAVSVSGWETVREDLPSTEETLSQITVESSSLPTQKVEGEEVLLFYWLDAFELPYHQPGTAYLFGKVWHERAATYVSCCVVVKNILRCLYFLPREKALTAAGQETDTSVSFEDVYSEFNAKYAEPHRIMKFTSRRVNCKYAFDQSDVPQESEYLQVMYSAEYEAPPTNASGKTFSRVFGTTTSSLEQLIVTCQLRGPCWLHIALPKGVSHPVSWCKVECVVGGVESVKVAPSQAPPPPLVTMSLSFTLSLNSKTHTNEILCMGALVHSTVALDKPPPKKPFEADFCTICRPVDRSFPFGFEEHLKKKRFNVEVAPSERALLAYVLAKIHRVDPDLLVGHNLTAYHLAVLQSRLAACKVPHWSRVSRLRRHDMPKGRWAGSSLCAGRLVCDVMTSARELIRARSYDLTELCRSVLHKPHQQMEHNDIQQSFNRAEQLGSLVAHTMEESLLTLQLMYELNVLPLAYQITCIAGNVLSRTLTGGRAERNEYLLLHAFTAKGYICPDKLPASRRQQHTEMDEEEVGGATGVKGRRKPTYAGGLVLEPKKGFYDTFILLLDYNSLYPSIIQEYNICFTTIDHAHFSEDKDDYSQLQLPDPSLSPGILPSEIRVLVERRRQVKQLMKGCAAGSEQHTQYDIRQKALKLTANSMYGCLGFTHSRFHARPLAALITGKGREILSHTKELAEKLGLDVIYGDTDSVMINSHSHSLSEAQAMAQRFKTEVNKLYRLLEIDIDGIFQSMLLLKKKKYAAKTVEIRDGHRVYGMELKGLDIVRRDWCELAKRAGHHVLDYILSGRSLDEVIDEVQTFLQQLSHDVEVGKVPVEDYIITKSLTKSPTDYPDKRSLPHVQVALRMQSRGKHVQAGDVIPYVMCKASSSQPASLNAYHPDELASHDHLVLDHAYYLRHQLHAVVSRLCEPIDGLDSAQIASSLGMDPSGFRSASRGLGEGEGEGEGGRGGGRERYADCQLPTVTCPSCAKLVVITGATVPPPENGWKCSQCKAPLPVALVTNSLTLLIKASIRQYYLGWMQCDDKICQFRSRSVSVGVGGASCPLCHHGKMQEELPASTVCRQLQFYMCCVFPSSQSQTGEDYGLLRETVATFLDWNAYSRVDLARVFPVL